MHETVVFCSRPIRVRCPMSSLVVKKVHVRYLISWWVSCSLLSLLYEISHVGVRVGRGMLQLGLAIAFWKMKVQHRPNIELNRDLRASSTVSLSSLHALLQENFPVISTTCLPCATCILQSANFVSWQDDSEISAQPVSITHCLNYRQGNIAELSIVCTAYEDDTRTRWVLYGIQGRCLYNETNARASKTS